MSESDKAGTERPQNAGKQAAKPANHGHIGRVAAWPRAMRAEQAAEYISISRSLFLKLVDEKVLPAPTKIPGHDVTTWDRFDLDAAYDDWKNGNEPSENTVHKRLRELADGRRKEPI